MQLPAVNLAIMQPVGYVHSLGFLDQARYVRHQLRRLGVESSITKNRVHEDRVNFVFGAHLGFPPEWQRRHPCIFVNLEQLGDGGALVSPDYLRLLRHAAVVDYDARNAAVYASDPAEVALISFLHAPYLETQAPLPLDARPIDLLFFGSVNARRQRFLERVQACGVQVTTFDHPLYGAERDAFVRQARAVLNCHFYESSRLEQARIFQCLSLGTPVVSERTPLTSPSAPFEDAVFWIDDTSLAPFFTDTFRSARFATLAAERLAAFRAHDPIDAYAELLAFAAGFTQGFATSRPAQPWRPTRMNLGSGKDYKPGWLNVDVLERAGPDLVLDLAREIRLPIEAVTQYGAALELAAGTLEEIEANNVLEHVHDLPALMTTLLTLLAEGGVLRIEVPYEGASTAWQDPTHVRAMNEQSWLYYTEWFWYLGWFEHRFERIASAWLDTSLTPCDRDRAAFMRVTLAKVSTSARERTIARTMRPDFGGIEDDLPSVARGSENAAGVSPVPTLACEQSA
jgi:SAM-dependent methyltransferase